MEPSCKNDLMSGTQLVVSAKTDGVHNEHKQRIPCFHRKPGRRERQTLMGHRVERTACIFSESPAQGGNV